MMIRALWTGATGMRAQQFNIDSIANDLSNVNTTAYKKRHVSFVDLFYQNLRASGIQGTQNTENLPVGIQVGHGVRVNGTTPIMTTGGVTETGIMTDAMIVDPGSSTRNFFGVTLPDGSRGYTRDGTFRKNSEGNLTTLDGLQLDPPVSGIPDNAIDLQITEDGRVLYRTEQSGDLTEAGTISLYTFPNAAGLSPKGSNYWAQNEASGDAVTLAPGDEVYGVLRPGSLETSNVDAITEMVNMISAQRAYEFNSRSIQTSDEMLQTVNNLKR